MPHMELIFTMIGGVSTTEVSEKLDALDFQQNNMPHICACSYPPLLEAEQQSLSSHHC